MQCLQTIDALLQAAIDGLLSFRRQFVSSDALPFDSNFTAFLDPIIAPFWADHNRFVSSGSVRYRRTADISILRNVTEILAARNPELQSYQPLLAFIATWNGDVHEVSDLKTKSVHFHDFIVFCMGGSKAAAVLYWSYRTAHEWAMLYALLYEKTSQLTA